MSVTLLKDLQKQIKYRKKYLSDDFKERHYGQDAGISFADIYKVIKCDIQYIRDLYKCIELLKHE